MKFQCNWCSKRIALLPEDLWLNSEVKGILCTHVNIFKVALGKLFFFFIFIHGCSFYATLWKIVIIHHNIKQLSRLAITTVHMCVFSYLFYNKHVVQIPNVKIQCSGNHQGVSASSSLLTETWRMSANMQARSCSSDYFNKYVHDLLFNPSFKVDLKKWNLLLKCTYR